MLNPWTTALVLPHLFAGCANKRNWQVGVIEAHHQLYTWFPTAFNGRGLLWTCRHIHGCSQGPTPFWVLSLSSGFIKVWPSLINADTCSTCDQLSYRSCVLSCNATIVWRCLQGLPAIVVRVAAKHPVTDCITHGCGLTCNIAMGVS